MGASAELGTIVAGRYRLEEQLGEGGFGVVFRAQDRELQRAVALKLLLVGAVEVGARFRREAELAMRLSHANTVRTFDAGEDAVAGPYIAMELLEGVSLEAHLRSQGPMAPERAAQIVRAVLGSLEEAHRLGIVHRDIKPANVFLVRAPTPGVKVLDFGIAKSTNPDTRAGLTREGQTIGTPAYMAPEQISGGVLGPATDLYAVGLLLAEVLCGKPVYDVLGGLAVLVDKLEGKPAPLPHELVGTPLGAVVTRAVLPDPEKRFASAADMRRALDEATSTLSEDTFGSGALRVSRQTSGGWSAEQVSPSSGAAAGRSLSGPPGSVAATSGPAFAPTSGPVFAPTSGPAFAPTSASVHGPNLGTHPAPSTPRGPPPSPPSAFPVPAPIHSPSPPRSGAAAGCIAAAALGLLLVAASAVALWLAFASPATPGRRPAQATAPEVGPALSRAPPGGVEAAPPRAGPALAHLVRCAKLPTLPSSSINPSVWSAGFGVGDQSSSQDGAVQELGLGLTQGGAKVGELLFYEGPAVQERLERARASSTSTSSYAVAGRRLLFIGLPPDRAAPLLAKLC